MSPRKPATLAGGVSREVRQAGRHDVQMPGDQGANDEGGRQALALPQASDRLLEVEALVAGERQRALLAGIAKHHFGALAAEPGALDDEVLQHAAHDPHHALAHARRKVSAREQGLAQPRIGAEALEHAQPFGFGRERRGIADERDAGADRTDLGERRRDGQGSASRRAMATCAFSDPSAAASTSSARERSWLRSSTIAAASPPSPTSPVMR